MSRVTVSDWSILPQDPNKQAAIRAALGVVGSTIAADPSLTGNVGVPTRTAGDLTPNAASTEFVGIAIKSRAPDASFAKRVLALAKTQPVRIMLDGTSISENSGAPVQVIAEQLKAIYGDAQLWHQRMGILGGDWEVSYNGWSKQPYGGVSYNRLRGSSSSSAFAIKVYGSKIELWYSKETVANGASTFVLNIDGTDYTIDCTGASQSYGNVFTQNVALGTHTVTFNPPASGNVYVEHLLVSRGLPGIEIVRGNLGGSSLQNHIVVRPKSGTQVDGIAISGNSGLDAVFNRSDVQLVLYSGPANDAGAYNASNYQNGFARIVATTKANNVPLVIHIEPAGHYARPTDSGYTAYNTIKALWIATAAVEPHITLADWDAITRYSDLQTYADKYYAVTSGAVSGTVTGDYIHPNTIGQTAGTGLLANVFGVRMPNNSLETAVRDTIRSNNSNGAFGADAVVYDRSIGVVKKQIGWAVAITTNNGLDTGKYVPVYDGTGIKETGRPFDTISASGTSDLDGVYKTYANQSISVQVGSGLADGEKWTFTLYFKGTLTVSPAAGQFYFGNTPISTGSGAAGAINVTSTVLQCITFEWLPNASGDAISVTGTLYLGSCVTKTQGTAVKCVSGTVVKPHSFIYPDAKLTLDPIFNPVYLHQGYRDAAGVRKTLMGPVLKWDFAQYAAAFALYGDVVKTWESSWAVKGCYRLSDRTQANFSQVSITGTLTDVPGSIYTNGVGFSSTSPTYYQFPAIDLSAAGLYCTITVPMYGAANMRWQVQAINGGTTKYLNNDGTWTGTAGGTNFREATDNQDALCSFTFQPVIAQSGDPNYIGIVNPIIRLVRISGIVTAVGDATFCTGVHSMI